MAKRIIKIVFCILAAAALVLGCRYAVLWNQPRNCYLRERYGAHFVLSLSGEPRYNRAVNDSTEHWETESYLLLGTPEEELQRTDVAITAEAGRGKLTLTVTNHSGGEKGLAYVRLEEQFAGEWLWFLTADGVLFQQSAPTYRRERDQNGVVTLAPVRAFQQIGDGAAETVTLSTANWTGQPMFTLPRSGHFRAVLLFTDGTKYAVEFDR